MAETVICPLCRQHPVVDNWCPNRLSEIPEGLLASDSGAQEASQRTDGDEDVTSRDGGPTVGRVAGVVAAQEGDATVCAVCGCPGRPGGECMQCGQLLLVSPARSRTDTAGVLVLPSGAVVQVPVDREILIGRHSEIAEIQRALEPYDGVSRRHCLLTISHAGDQLVVEDLHSYNGTWVGDSDPEQICAGGSVTVGLPARLRLGQLAWLTIHGGGSR